MRTRAAGGHIDPQLSCQVPVTIAHTYRSLWCSCRSLQATHVCAQHISPEHSTVRRILCELCACCCLQTSQLSGSGRSPGRMSIGLALGGAEILETLCGLNARTPSWLNSKPSARTPRPHALCSLLRPPRRLRRAYKRGLLHLVVGTLGSMSGAVVLQSAARQQDDLSHHPSGVVPHAPGLSLSSLDE